MDDYTLAGFELGKLTVAFIISATLIFIIYFIWNSGTNKEDDDVERGGGRQHQIVPGKVVTTLYAFELEPGTVVLQSEDGEFFRILTEYDAASRPNRHVSTSPPQATSIFNSPSTRLSNNKHYTVFDPDRPVEGSDSIPLPQCTRVHYQNSPSAPLLHDGEHLQQPHYTTFNEDGTWRPIKTLDFNRN